VASNIAEGYGRSTRGEYLQFLGHARGSISEVQTQLVISSELGFGQNEFRESVYGLSKEVSRMLIAMMKKLRN
jgi:four helix bundle protein